MKGLILLEEDRQKARERHACDKEKWFMLHIISIHFKCQNFDLSRETEVGVAEWFRRHLSED